MMRTTRRGFLKASARHAVGLTVLAAVAGVAARRGEGAADRVVEAWMDEWMNVPKAPGGTLHVSRFVEPVYFLTMPIAWKPNPGQTGFDPVQVPAGFVTDFASIPRVFWSLLRPDGEYTYPAIIHDYLYWAQTRPRDAADSILKFGMEDFGIHPPTVAAVYHGVRLGGGAAWNGNATLKKQGEKRVLKRFPDDPRARWADWKRMPDVFAD